MGVASLDLQQTDVGQGFIDYGRIINKPKINGVTLEGNLSTEDINIFIPQRVSELQNDAGYITKNVSDLVYYYDKTEVDNMISTIPKFDIKVVDALPTEDISPTTIYLLMVAGEDHFEEYIYVDDEWDKLGDGNIDLSDYTTYEYVDAELAEKVDAADLATVALSGRYSDLIGTPTNLSQFTNDTGFITAAALPTKTSDLTNDGEDGTSTYVESNELATVATSGSYNDLTDKPTIDFELVEMSYGESNAWAKFIAAYQGHKIVYCRASSNSNPATGAQGRKAFMAYVNNAENPTEVEFQYVRSVSSKTASQPVDQVFVYKLTNANGGTWTVTTRDMGPKLAQGTNTTVSYSNGTYTISATQPTVNDATLTIQKNGTTVETFTANSSTNKTANIVVPTKTSDLTNDSDFVNSTQVGTALAAYTYPGQDLYTQSDIDTMLAQLSSLKIEVVNALPQTGSADTIYLLRVRQQGNDIYQEYFWVNNAWELIGGIDLTDYYTKTEVNTLLTAKADVSAIPTKTSDLTNDSNFAVDANYVHTDNNYTTTEKNKLAGIAAGAEVNVQSDWNQTTTTADDFIKNKPSIPTKTSDLTNDSGFITTAAIPTNVSAFNNDAGYLDEIPDDSVGLNQLDSTVVNALNNINNKANTADLAAVAFSGDYDDLTDKPTIPTKTSDLTNDGADGSTAYLETDETAYATASIPYGKVDSTSTATAFTATVPGITQLRQGVSFWLENGVVTSASGFTININGLGAKPVYTNLAAGTRDTTIFNVAYTMLFVYDEDRVEGGAFICYRGYDANTNTIGYQLRTNSQTMPMTSITYRYRLLFTSADGAHYVPANNSTSTNATASRTVCQDPIDPFGPIFYYGTTASVAAGSRPAAANLWQQYAIALGYSFNRTNAALTLTSYKPVYVKAAPQSDGSAIIDATTPYVQDLPTTEDGKIYIFLGVAYSATNIELELDHPVYFYKDGAIRLWTNAAAGISSVAWGDITGTLSSQTDLNTALNAKANSADLATVATSGSYNDLANKPTIPTVNNATLTIQKNSTNVATFTANAASNVTANISVPTATSDLTNDSGFLTSSTLPIASTSSLGAVQVGSGLTISSGGVLSATGGGVADSVAWGHITGTLADQTDLQDELDAKANTADLATVATSGSYNDLSNKPTIPTVNDATLTIQKNGTTVQTFTANSSTNKTANITVPTKTSDLTNDSGFLTSYTETDPIYSASPAAGITATDISSWNAKSDFSGSYNDLTDKPTIPTVGNATLTIQKNGTNVQTFTANATSNKTANITVPTKTSELTNDSNFITSSGTVAKADQLTTARTIAIGTGATGTATSFDGSSNITIPITSMKEAYLEWGGKNITGQVTPVDAAIDPFIGSNKWAFANAASFVYEYSTDGGATWVDCGISDANRRAVTTTSGGYAIRLGNNSTTNYANNKLRLTFNSNAAGGNVYTSLRKILIYLSTNGATGTTVTVTSRTIGNYNNNVDTWTTVGTYNVSGWSGWNSIPYNVPFGGGASQTGQIAQIRLTFNQSGGTANMSVSHVHFIGVTNWSVPSELGKTGHLYTWDVDQNATFPASVSVTGSLKHNGYTYTLPNKNGTVAMTSDIPSVPTVDSALSTTSTNPVQNKVITANFDNYATNNSVATQLANKQNVLTAGDHINITGNTIKAVDYVHSDDPVSTTAVTPVVTNNMIADGTITADKLATGATVKLTLSTSDIGEGAALAANTLYGVYI